MSSWFFPRVIGKFWPLFYVFLEFLKSFPRFIKTYLKYLHFFLKIYVSEMAFLGLPHDFFLKEIRFFLELFIFEREPPRV